MAYLGAVPQSQNVEIVVAAEECDDGRYRNAAASVNGQMRQAFHRIHLRWFLFCFNRLR